MYARVNKDELCKDGQKMTPLFSETLENNLVRMDSSGVPALEAIAKQVREDNSDESDYEVIYEDCTEWPD